MTKLEKLSKFTQLNTDILSLIRGGNMIAEETRQFSTYQHCTGDCYDTTHQSNDDDGNLIYMCTDSTCLP